MKLVIKTSRTASGVFRAWCPALPGCVVLGRSLEEAREKIDQAVLGYVASLNVALPRELSRLCAFDDQRPLEPAAWTDRQAGRAVACRAG